MSETPAFRQRIRCFFGKHPGTQHHFAPYPYPCRVTCISCQRTVYFIDCHVQLTVLRRDGRTETVSGIRYASMDQWRAEREGA